MTGRDLASLLRPPWSAAFAPGVLPTVLAIPPLDVITRNQAWGGSTGAGVKVAVLDSGIDADHPAVGGVQGFPAIGEGQNGPSISRPMRTSSDMAPLAPASFESLRSSRSEFFGELHAVADRACFHHIPLACAANNLPMPSYPAHFDEVLSVAANEERDPECFAYNPKPPVEFGAPGIDLKVAWLDGGTITVTGTRFAALHITELVARLYARHPGLTVFQVKSILRALATNVLRDKQPGVSLLSDPTSRLEIVAPESTITGG